MTRKTYDDLLQYDTFEARYEFLKLKAGVGIDTFGHERFLNQRFYRSTEWKRVRDRVIARDRGFDLGVQGYEIPGRILVHHMNPITPEEVHHGSFDILDPEQMISVSHATHNAIHYGSFENVTPPVVYERTPFDTAPWR